MSSDQSHKNDGTIGLIFWIDGYPLRVFRNYSSKTTEREVKVI